MQMNKIWIEQCEAAKGIEAEFGKEQAPAYLIGEKFINFLDAAETHADFREEIPAFVAEIKSIFELWKLACGNWPSIRKSPGRPKSSIHRTTMIPVMPSTKKDWNFESLPTSCCWWNEPENGYWKDDRIQS